MTSDYARAVTAYRQFCSDQQLLLLTDARLHAFAHLAHRALAEADAEIAGLRAGLDRYQGREVHYTTDAHLEEAAALVTLHAIPGTVVRATDTGRELELSEGHEWLPR